MRSLFAISILIASSPAAAQSAVSVTEPSNLGLAVLGLVGLIVGRQISKRSHRDNSEE